MSSTELAPVQLERQLPPELAFMSYDAVSDFREQQEKARYNARVEALQGGDIFLPNRELIEEADNTSRQGNADTCRAYVAQHFDAASNPQLFNDLTTLVGTVSIYNMDHTKWALGDADEDGNFTKPETSGKAMLETALQTLMPAPSPEDIEAVASAAGTDANPDLLDRVEKTDEILQGIKRLDNLRQEAAALSVKQRRQLHGGGKNRKQLQHDFEAANQQYQQAHIALMGKCIAQLRAKGVPESALLLDALAAPINEFGRFNSAEKEILDADTSLRGRFARFIAKTNKRLFIGTAVVGVGIGAGVRELMGTGVRQALTAATGGLAIGALAAAGSTRAVLKSVVTTRAHQLTRHQDLFEADNATIKQSVHDLHDINWDTDAHEALIQSSDLVRATVAERIRKDQRYNRKRAATAAVIGAVAGVAGYAVASVANEAIEHFTSGDHLGDHATQPTHQPSPHHTSHSHKPQPQPHRPGYVNGFNTHVQVESGHGYTQELQDLAEQKHIHLSGADSYRLYEHLEDKFGGHLFTNDHSYNMGNGNFGISHPGAAHWNPAAIHEMQRWLEENDLDKKAA